MAKVRKGKNRTSAGQQITDYRHESATRMNNPPAKIAAEGTVPVIPKAAYACSPRRALVFRFDSAS